MAYLSSCWPHGIAFREDHFKAKQRAVRSSHRDTIKTVVSMIYLCMLALSKRVNDRLQKQLYR